MFNSSNNSLIIQQKPQRPESPNNPLNIKFHEILESNIPYWRALEEIFQSLANAQKTEELKPMHISYLMTRLVEKMNFENLKQEPYFPLFDELIKLADQQTTFDPIAACSYINVLSNIQKFLPNEYTDFRNKVMNSIEKNIKIFDEKNLSLLLNHMYEHLKVHEDFPFSRILFFALKEIQSAPEKLSYKHLHQLFIALSRLSDQIPNKQLLGEITTSLIKRTVEEINCEQYFSLENLIQIFYSFGRLPVDDLSLSKEIGIIMKYTADRYQLQSLKNSHFHGDALVKQMLLGLNALPDPLFFGVYQTKILTALIQETNDLFKKDQFKFFKKHERTSTIFTERNLNDLITLFKNTEKRFKSKTTIHPKIDELSWIIGRLEETEKLNAERKTSEFFLAKPIPYVKGIKNFKSCPDLRSEEESIQDPRPNSH